jgi:hypothetical protein
MSYVGQPNIAHLMPSNAIPFITPEKANSPTPEQHQ